MKSILRTIPLAIAMLFSVSCNGHQPQTSNAVPSEEESADATVKKGKALIVFFSHAGENYAVGNIKEGNTKLVADYIRDVTKADVFEVVAEKSYDMPYSKLTELAKREQEKGELPKFKGKVNDIDQYDVVFVGTPIWWGTFPQVFFTFFNSYDLSGKTIIPFSTHEGSGLGSIVGDLKRIYPKAKVIEKGLAIKGSDVRTHGKRKVEKWLAELGYN